MQRLTFLPQKSALGSSYISRIQGLCGWHGLHRHHSSFSLSGSRLLEVISESRTQRNKAPFLVTTAKKELVDTIAFKVSAMVQGDFVDTCGVASSMIHGEKGIRKTATLKDATHMLPSLCENLIPLYADYLKDELPKPSVLLRQALLQRGAIIPHPSPTLSNLDNLTRSLENHDLYCLFILDEVDNLYTSTAQREERLKILQELAYLGNLDSGRVVSIVCGSSSVLPLLLSKNLTKYPRIALEFLSLPMLRTSMAASTNLPESLRSKLLISAKHGRQGELIRHISEWDPRAEFTRTQFGPLIKELNTELIKKNHDLLCGLYNKPSLSEFQKTIDTTNWLTELQPLTEREITERLLPRLNHTQEKDLYDRWSTPDILALVDKGWFSSSPQLTLLYPRTCYQLYLQYVSSFSQDRPGTKLWQNCFTPEFRNMLASFVVQYAAGKFLQ
ncbi:hypothetical protein QOT17_023825 [Balamuthia mandrillaris]